MPSVILAKIGSFLTYVEAFCKFPLICKNINQVVKTSLYVKSLNAELWEFNRGTYQITNYKSTIDNFIVDQKLLNKVQIEDDDIYRAMRLLKLNFDSKKKELLLIPIESSSKDHNQSVHRTINKNCQDQFWSSGPSDSPENNEWLEYKIPISMGSQQPMLQGAAIITKLKFKVFDPKFLQQVSHKYAPKAI